MTSGTFSPLLGHGIALAYLSPADAFERGAAVEIDIRGRTVAGDGRDDAVRGPLAALSGSSVKVWTAPGQAGSAGAETDAAASSMSATDEPLNSVRRSSRLSRNEARGDAGITATTTYSPELGIPTSRRGP